MQVQPTDLKDAMLFTPRVFEDARGSFFESWNERVFTELGLEAQFVQDNQSESLKGVLRGLHLQYPKAQGKLVRVVRGAVFDVIVDLRISSPTFRQWQGFELSERNRQILWVPPGFAHGFLVLEDCTTFLYNCTEFYAAEHERSLLWSDPDLAIDWPTLDTPYIVSEKDAAAARLGDIEPYR